MKVQVTVDLDASALSITEKQQPIPSMIWTLGCTMFLLNLSFVMVYSFSAIYLKTLLGVSTTWIGFLEGSAEALSFLMKLFSGMFADVLRRRKPVMVIGYTLSILSRPLLAMAGSFSAVFMARLMERIGNGIQASPRDAIVADVAPPKRIGASYGLKRSLGTIGSFCGAICGYFVMVWTNENFQHLFWLACIPAFIALILLLVFVKEPKKFEHPAISAEAPQPAVKRRYKMSLQNFSLLGQTFWLLMLVNAIFMLSRMSEQFLVLHARSNLGLAIRYAPTVMMLFNLGWCASSYPVGVLADRMNRYWFLTVGIIFIVFADLTLANATNLPIFYVGVLLWGIQYGMTQNVFVSLIAEIVPEHLRGTGFGCYYVICAISMLIGDTVAGKISHHYTEASAFLTSAIVALISLLTLIIIMGYKRRR